MSMQRRRIRWNGVGGLPGTTTLYTESGAALSGAIRTFFEAIKTYIPSGVSITYDVTGDLVDEANGHIVGTWTDTAAAATTCTAASWSGPAGCVVHWLTADVGLHRRIRGRTFLVPMTSSTSTGVPSSTQITAIQTAASALVATATGANALLVWKRPTFDGATPGSKHVVTAALVPTLAAVLRSRRD